ncbi:MaoC family dehydratase N-terminal domain-containing protein [Phenylobacterium sp. LjRoot219]|uniref:FAS1-like dehydratase domain-containing protein n=1 Tax=Phenylobacterium sp. LjRoot219 TaxID=3342283 RepID=UPI003ECD336F
MSQAAVDIEAQLDLTDVEPRVGQLVGGGQRRDPCSPNDIRRWVMAMDYPNPIHWDEDFAANSKLGGIVAPQSFAACMDIGHGVQPACVGRIPGSHLIFGGEEWWFYGARIRPGDLLFQTRRFHDIKLADTKFAGPTLFSRGDTIHHNQHGGLVAKERATSIRYLAAEAEKRKMYANQLPPKPRWTREKLAEIDKIRHAWILSGRGGASPRFDEVQVGDKLPRRVIGPHTITSFTTEYRAFSENVWGGYKWVAPEGVNDPWINQDAGWVEGFQIHDDLAAMDPRYRDGLYTGPSRGHVDDEYADEIGMARAYGYGATMGAWVTDYLAYWAGWDGFVRHVKSQFRGPAFEGDVTFFDAEVAAKKPESEWGVPLVALQVKLANQDGDVVVNATAEVELPLV